MFRALLPFAGTLGLGFIYASTATSNPTAEKRFAVAKDDARQRLVNEFRLVEGSGLGSLTLTASSADENNVRVWVHRAGAKEDIECAAKFDSESVDEAVVTTNCDRAGVGKTKVAEHARKMLNVVVAEHVRASIAQEPYNIKGVANQTIAMAAGGAFLIQPPSK
jgi:hypothetical protein